jgi:hypothetical protein
MICVADTSRCQGCFCLFKLPLLLLLLLLLLQDCVDFCYRAYTDDILECAPPPVAFCRLFIVLLLLLLSFFTTWQVLRVSGTGVSRCGSDGAQAADGRVRRRGNERPEVDSSR